jgi:PAS domain S-box-containing protein
VNVIPSPAGDGGFALATATLRVEPDVVSLCRRVRQAAEDFGLDGREIRRLSAAVFEVGQWITSCAPGTKATVALGDGPSLGAHFGVSDASRLGTPDDVERILSPLRTLVHRADLLDGNGDATICVAVLFRSPAPERRALGALPARRGLAQSEPPTDEGLREEHGALRQSYDELQDELQETNRGVVALYAELDDHAERLRLAEDRLRLLLDSVQDYAICMLSREGIVTSWNAGAERLFGFTSDEILGRTFSMFYPVQDRDAGAPDANLRQAEADGRLASEGVRVRHDGRAFDAHVVLTPVRDAGQELRGFSLVVRDITERKRLEDDLRRRAEDLAEANRAKEDFLATLSHELRTPLNAMLGWTRLLRTGKLDAAGTVRALETIERNAHLQEQLIADILDVSRIVTGKLRLEIRPTDLTPLIDATLDAVRPAADAKGVRLTSHVEFSSTVLGDPDRLQQVIWNLLSNAIKFTPPGGSIGVSLERDGPSALLTVKDTGEGISSDLLPYVFDRFRQGDASVTRPHGGLGLGLSIVRHLVELHGGEVQVSSDGTGTGATFTVRLPLRVAPRAREPELQDAQTLSGLKVLVVDDESDARDVMAHGLARCGASTAAASSTREALLLLDEFKPDVLVSDLRMPGEDGYALIRRVRASAAADLPALAVTGFAQVEERRRALTAGYQGFVPKGVEFGELAAVIRSIARKD